MKEIDVRGLSCPEPLLIVRDEIKKESSGEYKILANEAHTVKNISNYLESIGKKYSVSEVGMEYEILVK